MYYNLWIRNSFKKKNTQLGRIIRKLFDVSAGWECGWKCTKSKVIRFRRKVGHQCYSVNKQLSKQKVQVANSWTRRISRRKRNAEWFARNLQFRNIINLILIEVISLAIIIMWLKCIIIDLKSLNQMVNRRVELNA